MDHGVKESKRHNLEPELSFWELETNEINNNKSSFSQQKTLSKEQNISIN